MTCQVCQRFIFELVDGALTASKEARVLAHTRECAACGRFLEAELARLSALPGLLNAAAGREGKRRRRRGEGAPG